MTEKYISVMRREFLTLELFQNIMKSMISESCVRMRYMAIPRAIVLGAGKDEKNV